MTLHILLTESWKFILNTGKKLDPGMPKLTGESQENAWIIMANEYLGKISPKIPMWI